jgi:hypothetical protein
LTVHLVMPAGNPGDAFLQQTARDLETRFGIAHATLQIEHRVGGSGPALSEAGERRNAARHPVHHAASAAHMRRSNHV